MEARLQFNDPKETTIVYRAIAKAIGLNIEFTEEEYIFLNKLLDAMEDLNDFNKSLNF